MQLPFNKTPVALGRCDRLSGWQSAFEVDGRAHPGGILAGSNLFQPPVDCPITTDADVYNLARERAAQARTTRQKRPADLTMLWSSMIKLGLTRMPAPLFHAARRGKWRSRVRPFGGFARGHGGLAVAERTVGKDQTVFVVEFAIAAAYAACLAGVL